MIIGAGPAGLTAAYELAMRYGIASTVLEADYVVGGISRTVERDGWRFDIGGHRFFTKVKEVEDFWHEILPDEDFMLAAPHEPDLLRGQVLRLSPEGAKPSRTWASSRRCAASCPMSGCRIRPAQGPDDAGGLDRRPFRLAALQPFFKTYNEKLWGVPHREPARRLRGPAHQEPVAVQRRMNALLPRRNQKDITSLIEEFQYPKLRSRHDVGEVS